ncbi:site-2 protease family protein [Nakamurella antarctica]|uniref:Zinc metalloprotease n=1 Tax=Nakamurella antarctica TaxID=1902245 RepID=A0A3G8ZL75_9ACTN|nr:site-2 protease family protein [Nakamurella antarctica]AZI57908.1 site-2 protease family protein [Nakamurella antarctica]
MTSTVVLLVSVDLLIYDRLMSARRHASPHRGNRLSAGIRVGRILGIPITVAPSTLISVTLIMVAAAPVIHSILPALSTSSTYLVGLVLAMALQISVLIHELGHCVAATRLGVEVREVRLFILGGVSEIGRSLRTAREEALIAVAGPVVSVALAGIFFSILPLTTSYTIWWLLALAVAWSNTIIAVFNLLPALPLDGGRVLRAGMWQRMGTKSAGTRAAVGGGYVVAAGLVAWGGYQIAGGGREGLLQAIVAVALAYFVASGARAEGAEAAGSDGSMWPPGTTVQTLARPSISVDAEATVTSALAAAAGREVVLVDRDGVAVSILDRAAAESAKAHSPSRPAKACAQRVTGDNILLSSDGPPEVIEQVRSAAATHFLLIGADGHPQGVLLREDVPRAKVAGRNRRSENK